MFLTDQSFLLIFALFLAKTLLTKCLFLNNIFTFTSWWCSKQEVTSSLFFMVVIVFHVLDESFISLYFVQVLSQIIKYWGKRNMCLISHHCTWKLNAYFLASRIYSVSMHCIVDVKLIPEEIRGLFFWFHFLCANKYSFCLHIKQKSLITPAIFNLIMKAVN